MPPRPFSLTLTDPQEVDGLPPSLLAQAAQAAQGDGDPERYSRRWSLAHHPRLSQLHSLYAAQSSSRPAGKALSGFITRASEGDLNNAPNIEQILKLRQEMAEMLGYDTYADLSIARKMADSVQAVETLMQELREASYDKAVQELETLTTFAKKNRLPEADQLMHWDIPFWSERMREEKYG
jgi:oligopeptidase A